MSRHPLPFIPELKKIIRIKDFSDILYINDFVYSLVPSVYPPFDDGQSEELITLYDNLKQKKVGGWCSLNTIVLNRVLSTYGVESDFLNYGFSDKHLTHMVLLVHYKDKRYVLDPFLNKHYRNKSGCYLTYEDLIVKLVNRKLDDIVPVYGDFQKPVKYIPDPLDRDEPEIFSCWINYLPKIFELKVIQRFKKAGLKEKLEIFESDNLLFLMFFPLKG